MHWTESRKFSSGYLPQRKEIMRNSVLVSIVAIVLTATVSYSAYLYGKTCYDCPAGPASCLNSDCSASQSDDSGNPTCQGTTIINAVPSYTCTAVTNGTCKVCTQKAPQYNCSETWTCVYSIYKKNAEGTTSGGCVAGAFVNYNTDLNTVCY